MHDETTPMPLPGETPTAYLVRAGATAKAYAQYEALRDRMIVNQLACVTRRDEAVRAHKWFHSIKLDDITIKGTDMPVNVVAFYSAERVTEPAYNSFGIEREVIQIDLEAVYDAATWEEITKFVDVDEDTIEQELRK